jgi:DNA-binding response OmpR family regulator
VSEERLERERRGRRPSGARVLLIDDDPLTRGLVRGVLERAGHDVREAANGLDGLRELYAGRADLVILDVHMPGLDGFQTLGRIREVSEVPVLMLTAREAELDRVRGLQSGADDYVVKPFGSQELAARVQALLRRAPPAPAAAGGGEHGVYADPLLTIDFAQRAVRFRGREARLTPMEFRLLATLVRHPNQVLSPEQLLELVWNDASGVAPAQVKLYIGYLRRKLAPAAPLETPIENVRGFGYRYRRPERATGSGSAA